MDNIGAPWSFAGTEGAATWDQPTAVERDEFVEEDDPFDADDDADREGGICVADLE